MTVAAGSGMTMPAGVAVTPSGSTWVSDQLLGICRVEAGNPARLVPSPYCRPEAATELDVPRPGPATPNQMAFDPGSSNFFVAEGNSKSAGVWRMHWNASSETIDGAQHIVSAGRNRVFALALGTNPDGTVYVDFNGRDDATIHRLNNAAAAAPVTISATPVVGVATAPGVLSMTNLDGALYLAETGGVTRVAAPGPAAPVALTVPGFPAGLDALPNALAADAAHGRVYVGTGNVSGVDRVDVLTPTDGEVSTYDTGFALVTAIGVRADGGLLVADDPLTSAGAPESLGQSRLWDVPLHLAHLPTVKITAGPEVYSSATSASFAFTSSPRATFDCRLDGAGWAPCGSGPSAGQTYSNLGDGIHVFEVRGAAGANAARYTFSIDTVAPVASIDMVAADAVTEADALRVRFSADEFGVTYACELDGRALPACDSPLWLRSLGLGRHTFAVTPTDLAANVGQPRAWTFERIAPPPPPAPTPAAAPTGSSDPASDAAGPGPLPLPAAASSVAGPAPSCRPLAAAARTGSYRLSGGRGRMLTVRISPPGDARVAKLTLRPRANGTWHAQKIALLPVSGTNAQDLRIGLTRAQAARLRSRRATVGVAYGSCASPIGSPAELTPATTGHAR
ncbi:MAG TPA: hypothetical protein VGC59_06815 [Solirubrobacteraceae bacterium]